MLTLKGILVTLFICLSGCDEIDDTTVEFSVPKMTEAIESPKNATTLITKEIESHVFHSAKLESEEIEKREENASAANVTFEAKHKIKVECAPRVIPEDEVPKVEVTNSTMLIKYLTPPVSSNASTNNCVIVLFYSPQCVFSARAAPHYNALARVYPNITFYAVDAMDYGNLHVRYGLVYVPNVMLFHNAKPIARFNETTMNLDNFVKFINRYTGQEHNETTLNVTSADMVGPVPSILTKKVDYILILAWVFTIACMCFGFVKSSFCRRLVDLVKNTWQEAAAAQHEHVD